MWPIHMFGWLLIPILSVALTAAGYLSLTVWIPRLGQQDRVRTDVYASRVSCWMVFTGLAIMSLWAISVILVRSLAVLEALGVLHKVCS